MRKTELNLAGTEKRALAIHRGFRYNPGFNSWRRVKRLKPVLQQVSSLFQWCTKSCMGTEYIMGYAGSAAENRARTHGVAFIEIDDGWLASH